MVHARTFEEIAEAVIPPIFNYNSTHVLANENPRIVIYNHFQYSYFPSSHTLPNMLH